jgi:hypothetical protein
MTTLKEALDAHDAAVAAAVQTEREHWQHELALVRNERDAAQEALKAERDVLRRVIELLGEAE